MSFSDLTLKQLKQCLQKYRHMHTIRNYWKMTKTQLIENLSQLFEIRDGALYSLLNVTIPEIPPKKEREIITESSISESPITKNDVQKIMKFAKKVKSKDILLTLCKRLNDLKDKIGNKLYSENQRKIKSNRTELSLLSELNKSVPKIWDLYNNLITVN